jgi:histone H3/H4
MLLKVDIDELTYAEIQRLARKAGKPVDKMAARAIIVGVERETVNRITRGHATLANALQSYLEKSGYGQ